MPRTTVDFSQTLTGVRNYVKKNSDGVVISTGQDHPVVLSYRKVRGTTNTPGFRSQRTWEGLPMNPFSYFERSDSYPYGIAEQNALTTSGFTEKWTGRIPDNGYTFEKQGSDQSKVLRVHDESLQKFYSNLKGMRVNLGVVFGERKQTSNLLLGTAGRLANGLRDLRKGDFRGVAMHLGMTQSDVQNRVNATRQHVGRRKITPLKALGNEWLALQYGWKPLLSDVYNAAESLAAHSDVRRVRCSASSTYRWSHSSATTWLGITIPRREVGTYSRKYVAIFSHSSEILKDLSSFGVTNPASVAWELLPWSFVIDWFIPIGQYIDTWDATLGLEFEKGCVTTFSKYRVRYMGSGTKPVLPYYDHVYVNGHASRLEVDVQRGALASFPSASIPNFQPHITQNRGISTLALLRQRLKL